MRTPIPAALLAEQLMHEFIANINQEIVSGLAIPPAKIREYEAKVLLFRTASVIMALRLTEPQFPPFQRVEEDLEKLIYAGGMTQENLTKVQTIQAAMASLATLLDSGKPASWSMAWLKDIELDETNPVTLHQFGWFWMDFLKASQNALAQFDPR
jgi:hypothetical protein